MKVIAGGVLSVVLGVAMLPAVLAGGDEVPPLPCGAGSADVQTILATIRTVESGGNYRAQARGSTASGAYQFIDGTWNGYGGYTRAADAPPAVQDAKAAAMVLDDLERFGDISAVPVIWYIGHLPAAGSAAWDTVPYRSAGNVLTPRQYQARWLRELARQQATPGGAPPSSDGPDCSGTEPSPQRSVTGESRQANRDVRALGAQSSAANVKLKLYTTSRNVGTTRAAEIALASNSGATRMPRTSFWVCCEMSPMYASVWATASRVARTAFTSITT